VATTGTVKEVFTNWKMATIVFIVALLVTSVLLYERNTSRHHSIENIHLPTGEHANNLKKPGKTPGSENVSPLGVQTFHTIISEAQKYVGWPYVWGGANPSAGFDCSGFTQWTFAKAGIKLPRTAQEQYDASSKILPAKAKPGDFVFFTSTYESDHFITHVGIFLGNGEMIDSDDSGIGIQNIHSPYWKSHLAGFGRVLH
jgi:cell wall-associated NlpC family hydrolase